MMDKKQFLQTEFCDLLSQLQPLQMGSWGKMNAQQMVEHMSEYVRIASGKEKMKPVLDEAVTQKMYTFMMSEKPFRENTPNQLLPEIPEAAKRSGMDEALTELQNEINDFFEIYLKNPGLRNINPFFGNLNFEEQVQLLYKHAIHHARQFGLV
jgi:hypothetical protein